MKMGNFKENGNVHMLTAASNVKAFIKMAIKKATGKESGQMAIGDIRKICLMDTEMAIANFSTRIGN